MAGSWAVGREREAPISGLCHVGATSNGARRRSPRPGKHEHRSTVRFLAQIKTALAHVIASPRWLAGLVATIAVALALTTVGYSAATRKVTLSVDGRQHTVRTFGHD